MSEKLACRLLNTEIIGMEYRRLMWEGKSQLVTCAMIEVKLQN